MARLFFSLLLCCVSFFAASQDSTVCIPSDAARWFLEADDERWVLREKDSLQTELITNLGDQLLVKDQIIVTHQNDSALYASREATFLEQIRILTEDRDKAEGILRLRKALEILGAIVIIVISIL